MRILIVDDETPIREWIKMTIESIKSIHCEVFLAHNGKDAYAIFEQKNPDIIITDIRMPIIDGIELAKRVREKSRNCKIIILSNYDDFDYARQLLPLGIKDYILKTEISKEYLERVLKQMEPYISDDADTKRFHIQKIITDIVSQRRIDPVMDSELPDVCFKQMYSYFVLCLKSGDQELMASDFTTGISAELEFFPCHEYCFLIVSLDHCASQSILLEKRNDIVHHLFKLAKQSIGVSNLYHTAKQMAHSIYESLCAVDQAFYHSGNNIFEYRETKSWEHEEPLGALRTAISKAIYGKEDLEGIFSSGIIHVKQLSDISSFSLKRFCKEILSEVTMKTEDCDSEGMFKAIEKIIRDIDSIDNLDSLLAYMTRELKGHASSQKHYSKLIRSAIQYINANYSTIVDMREISDYLKINYDYFCRLFSSEVGMTFTKYLTKVRMNQALYLLENKNYRVSDVALMVGYSDIGYFSKIFKRTFNQGPMHCKNGS